MPKGVNNRRLFFARRRIQKHNDSWALFPEMQTLRTPEDDILEIDRKSIECQLRARSRRAAEWRAVRRKLWESPDRQEILAYWQMCDYPGDPYRLAALVAQGVAEIRKRNTDLARARIMGALMTQTMQEAEPQQLWESYKAAFFRRLEYARKKAEQLRPDLFARAA
jgi:hypothetical protein